MLDFKKQGIKYGPGLIAILVIAAVSILLFVYKAIAAISTITSAALLTTYFPIAVYILMCLSIIVYIINYSKRDTDAPISVMLMMFCALIAATTIIGATTSLVPILCCNVVILILVPFVNDDFSKYKKVLTILIIVFLLTAAVGLVNITYGASAIKVARNPLDLTCAIYNYFCPCVLWAMFMALYIVRLLNGTEKAFSKTTDKKTQDSAKSAPEVAKPVLPSAKAEPATSSKPSTPVKSTPGKPAVAAKSAPSASDTKSTPTKLDTKPDTKNDTKSTPAKSDTNPAKPEAKSTTTSKPSTQRATKTTKTSAAIKTEIKSDTKIKVDIKDIDASKKATKTSGRRKKAATKDTAKTPKKTTRAKKSKTAKKPSKTSKAKKTTKDKPTKKPAKTKAKSKNA